MLRRAERPEGQDEARLFRRFSEMVDRPMGILDAVESALKEPGAVGCLALLLESSGDRVRERAVWALGYAAAKGADISEAKEGLQRLLEWRDPDLVRGCAYALANHYMNTKAGADLDPLRAHRNPHARIGARLAELDRP